MIAVVNDEYLTVRDVALRLRRSEATIRRVIVRGELVAHTVGQGGRGYLVDPVDLQAFIAKSRTDCADAAGKVAGGNEDYVAKAS
jgi:excisionase family DNA binding protein